MNRLLHMMIKEFIQLRRDKRLLPLIFIAPILQIIILGYAATTDVRNVALVVYDADHSSASRELLNKFGSSGYFSIAGTVRNPSEGLEYLDHTKALLFLSVPNDFSEQLAAGGRATLQIVADGADANTARVGLNYAFMITQQFGTSVLQDRVAATGGAIRIPTVNAEPRIWFNPELKSSHYMVPGVVVLVLMIVTMAFTAVAIVKEKEIGTMEQLLVSPLKPLQLIVGKLLPYILIGIVEIIVVLTVAINWFGIPLRGELWLLLSFCALFVMTTLGFGLFVSTVSNTQQQALMTAQFLVFFPSIMLSGFTFPIENMPRVIQCVTYIIPLRYALEAIRGIFLRGVGLDVLWPQALALFVLGIAILTLAVLRFRRNLG